jgi:hypothetical protein
MLNMPEKQSQEANSAENIVVDGLRDELRHFAEGNDRT